jgi:hypothetical protein
MKPAEKAEKALNHNPNPWSTEPYNWEGKIG